MRFFKITSTIILLLAFTFNSQAQDKAADTTIRFQVKGVCGMCKNRIEKSINFRGLRSAKWEAASQTVEVTYKPGSVTIPQIHKMVAATGHDTELEKADDAVYKALPDCCLYRDIEASGHDPHHMEDASTDDKNLKGLVVSKDRDQVNPLPGANIFWLGTRQGTTSDEAGLFTLEKVEGINQIVISYAGYKTDTVSIEGMNDIEITLDSKEKLAGVVVKSRLASTYVSKYDPFRTAIITQKELLKAACCNLSESFETNPAVDVAYSDAVTGAKQIQLLGLSGVYTQLTVENLPGPRGIATHLGLNSIAGPWIESIHLIKGTGSVVNGFESIAGQINVELKKPNEADPLYLNGYVNSMGKTDVNLNLAHQLNDKWSTGLLLHDDFLYNKVDMNKDGFRDQPTGNQFSAVHRWQYIGDKGLMSQFGIKAHIDNKTGGELQFDSGKDKFSQQVYGLGIKTNRYEVFAKNGYVFPEKMYKSIGLQLSAFDHQQDAYFGLTTYDARQRNLYGNLIYQSRIGSEKHSFKSGISFQYDDYEEQLQQTNYDRKEVVPGVFTEYTFAPVNKLDVVAGLRADHHNLFGWFATPRLNVRYAPFNNTTIRLSAGRGQRTANIIAENMGLLVSARQFNIIPTPGGMAYGLKPEVSWNKGISLDQQFRLFNRTASFGIDFYRNDFVDQVVIDIEDPRQVKFYNLDGESFSNSLQAEVSFIPVKDFDVKLAYRYFDVQTTYGNILKEKPFTAKHRGFINLAYMTNGWNFDYTLNLTGSKRIPSTSANPHHDQLPEVSPSFVTMNAQVSKTLGAKKLFDVYLGGENLGNFMQQQAIIANDRPFGPTFDASMIWGPISGRMIYAGFRYTLEK